jgi:hypothetical protein
MLAANAWYFEALRVIELIITAGDAQATCAKRAAPRCGGCTS